MQCPAIFNLQFRNLFDSLGRLPYKVILLTLSFHEMAITIVRSMYVPSSSMFRPNFSPESLSVSRFLIHRAVLYNNDYTNPRCNRRRI